MELYEKKFPIYENCMISIFNFARITTEKASLWFLLQPSLMKFFLLADFAWKAKKLWKKNFRTNWNTRLQLVGTINVCAEKRMFFKLKDLTGFFSGAD